jgi:hypothetical protein
MWEGHGETSWWRKRIKGFFLSESLMIWYQTSLHKRKMGKLWSGENDGVVDQKSVRRCETGEGEEKTSDGRAAGHPKLGDRWFANQSTA